MAFWARRLATTLALANGAGVVALSSYISNSKNFQSAAIVAYPALSLYLSGAVAAFVSFIISLLWASLRLDAYYEHFERLKKIRFSFSKEHDQLRNAVTISASILACLQLLAVISGGVFFYMASSTVVGALRQAACAQQTDMSVCSGAPSWLFPFEGDAAMGSALQTASRELGQTSLTPAGRFSVHTELSPVTAATGLTQNYPATIHISAPRAIHDITLRSSQTLRFDLIPEYGENVSCRIDVSDYFVGTTTPLVRNPLTLPLLKRSGTRVGKYVLIITPEATTIDVQYTEKDRRDYATLLIPTSWGEVVETDDVLFSPNISGLQLSDHKPPSLILFAPIKAKWTEDCVKLAKATGMPIGRQ